MSDNLKKLTNQEKIWDGRFGKEYSDRMFTSIKKVEDAFVENHGISRLELDEMFLGHLDRNIKILEVGCNVGMKLYSLSRLGFKNLYGIEIQKYAIEKSNEINSDFRLVNASALKIPFKDNSFDLVFTSGVLIHIAPEHLSDVMSEIYRCSSKYIWGWEYYAEEYHQVKYRDNEDLLWKGDFAQIYSDNFKALDLEKCHDIELLKQKGKFNRMFLLKKGNLNV